MCAYEENVSVIKTHRVALSIRQSAEWGMGSVQRSCGRLQHSLPANSQRRRMLLDLCVFYFNFRTRTVGLNQIQTVYHPDHDSAVLDYRMTHYWSLRNTTVY